MIFSRLLSSSVFVLLHPSVASQVGSSTPHHLRSGGGQQHQLERMVTQPNNDNNNNAVTDEDYYDHDAHRRMRKVCGVNQGLYWSSDCEEDQYCLGNDYVSHCYDGVDGDMCKGDDHCQDDLVCYGIQDTVFAYCRNKRNEGDECGSDKICKGYCHNLQCWDGSEGDSCGKEGDCQDGLTCIGTLGLAECRRQKDEGGSCGHDDDCKGYCHNLQCWDGSEGDSCGSEGDCQGDLTCIGSLGLAKCRRQKNEGEWCGHDDDCKGYCQFTKCWDGSRGDKCRNSSDCQGSLQCKKRCRICAQKECK